MPDRAIALRPPALSPQSLQRPIQDPLLAYLGSVAPKSRATVQERLRAVARLMQVPYEQVEWHELRAHHVEWIRQALLERGVAPRTVNVTLSALKGIAKRARNLNLMTSEEYDRIGGHRTNWGFLYGKRVDGDHIPASHTLAGC